jgi:hypothetical protein
VRVISAKAPAVTPTPPPTDARAEPTVVRPVHFDQLTEVVDQLRSGHAVRLALDGFADRAEQHRAWTFVHGAAYALEIGVSPPGAADETIFLDPPDTDGRRARPDGAPRDGTRPARARAPRNDAAPGTTCVLCDLRTADREVEPRLEMVIRRDGSRIWSPPAMVCSHCRTTIRHWQFALAWCSECERWGRRNVVSPCGQLYG